MASATAAGSHTDCPSNLIAAIVDVGISSTERLVREHQPTDEVTVPNPERTANQRVKALLARFLGDSSGATAIEYGFIAAIVGIGIVVGLTQLQTGLNTLKKHKRTIASPEALCCTLTEISTQFCGSNGYCWVSQSQSNASSLDSRRATIATGALVRADKPSRRAKG